MNTIARVRIQRSKENAISFTCRHSNTGLLEKRHIKTATASAMTVNMTLALPRVTYAVTADLKGYQLNINLFNVIIRTFNLI
jgi:hypothetical protein